MEKKEDVTDDEIILLQNIKKAKKSQCIQDKIKLQIKEIFKIKKVSAEFQEIHTDQKNMLIKLKEELKTVLTDDEINELNSIDHNGLEDANEDSTMPEDTDLRIVQSHSAGNENRKKKVSQEYMENKIQEMFDKLGLNSWSSHTNLPIKVNQHNECEENIRSDKAVIVQMKRLLEESETKVLQLRQDLLYQKLFKTNLLKGDYLVVPRVLYVDKVRQLGELRAEHENCLKAAINSDQPQSLLICSPNTMAASDITISESTPEPSTTTVQVPKHQLSNRRRRLLKMLRQKSIWKEYYQKRYFEIQNVTQNESVNVIDFKGDHPDSVF